MQLSTALSDEELFAAARSEMRIAPFGKAAERCTGRRMQRNEGDLPNLVNRTVSTPASRSTSSGWGPITSDRRTLVTAINRTDNDKSSAQSVLWRQRQRRRKQRLVSSPR